MTEEDRVIEIKFGNRKGTTWLMLFEKPGKKEDRIQGQHLFGLMCEDVDIIKKSKKVKCEDMLKNINKRREKDERITMRKSNIKLGKIAVRFINLVVWLRDKYKNNIKIIAADFWDKFNYNEKQIDKMKKRIRKTAEKPDAILLFGNNVAHWFEKSNLNDCYAGASVYKLYHISPQNNYPLVEDIIINNKLILFNKEEENEFLKTIYKGKT